MKVGLSDDDVEKKWTLIFSSEEHDCSSQALWREKLAGKMERDLVHTDCACSKFPQKSGILRYVHFFFCCFIKRHQNDVTVIYQLVSHGYCDRFLYDVVQYALLRLGLS